MIYKISTYARSLLCHIILIAKKTTTQRAFSMEEEKVEVGSSNLGKSGPTPHTPRGALPFQKLLCSS